MIYSEIRPGNNLQLVPDVTFYTLYYNVIRIVTS